MTKSLSIVIPAYNEARVLGACLDAIANQSVSPDEVIVVDNNSTDATVEIANRYDFVTVVQAPLQGIVHARDAGFNASRSDIIGRVDADTILDPDWVEQTKLFFANNQEVAAVTGDCYFYDIPLSRLMSASQAIMYHSIQRRIAGTTVLWGSNMALTSKAWSAMRNHHDTSKELDEDIMLSLRMADAGLKIEKSMAMVAGVSLRRGQLRPAEFYKYLSSWPRNYAACGRYGQRLMITALIPISWLGGVLAGIIRQFAPLPKPPAVLRVLYASLWK